MASAMWRGLVLLLMLASLAPAHAAESVGKVLFVRGLATAQGEEDGIPRFLSRGAPVFQGDVLTTSASGYAAVGFIDQGKVTLRPNTVFKVEEYTFEQDRESAVLRLFRGGLRALTGLIGKREPGRGYSLNTPVATIGIRGTRYDARLCEPGECEGGAPRDVGRVAFMTGGLRATGMDDRVRVLERGGAILEGDVVETDGRGIAVLVFRDDTRVTLQADSRFAVEEYEFEPETNRGNMVFRFLRGGLRALTGLVARNDQQAFRVATPVATIGIRGTGFDLMCQGRCFAPDEPGAGGDGPGEDGLYAEVWKGAIEFRQQQKSSVVTEGQKVFVKNRKTPPVQVPAIPPELKQKQGPRPDKQKIDKEELFKRKQQDKQTGQEKQKQQEEGGKQAGGEEKKQTGPEKQAKDDDKTKKKTELLVKVEEGEVAVKNDKGEVVLGPGEAGRVGPDAPPRNIPAVVVPEDFMRGVPRPDTNPAGQKDMEPCQVQ